MIVHSMSVEDKLHELKVDYRELFPKIDAACDSYVREAIKFYRSPLMRGCPLARRHLQIKSRNNNYWTILIFIKNYIIIHASYVTVPGIKNTYITFFTNNKNKYLVREFTPHFIQRYRERLLIPSGLDLSGGALIEDYLTRTGNSVDYEDEDGTNYSISTHGFVISQHITPEYLLMKTYIAKDDTFSKKKAEFSDKVAGLLEFFLFISENRYKLTYEIVEEQLRKHEEIFNEGFMAAYAQKFRLGRPIRYEDFEAFRMQYDPPEEETPG